MTYTAFDLAGKVALITGGNSGIGLGMAEAVAAAGAEVSIWGTNPDKNKAARESLDKYEPKITDHLVDVSDSKAVDEAFAQTLDDHGRVDACFANAGGAAGGQRLIQLAGIAAGPFLAVEVVLGRRLQALVAQEPLYADWRHAQCVQHAAASAPHQVRRPLHLAPDGAGGHLGG